MVFIVIGENPLECLGIMLDGAVGSVKGWSYLLYYATTFIFTGLCVAVAFHAGLFNIGGEGQATAAGIAMAFACLGLSWAPGFIAVPLAILAAVGTTLIPLLNALFAPKKQPQVQAYAAAPPAGAVAAWPTYADGVSPLPALPDSTPDWNAAARPRLVR